MTDREKILERIAPYKEILPHLLDGERVVGVIVRPEWCIIENDIAIYGPDDNVVCSFYYTESGGNTIHTDNWYSRSAYIKKINKEWVIIAGDGVGDDNIIIKGDILAISYMYSDEDEGGRCATKTDFLY